LNAVTVLGGWRKTIKQVFGIKRKKRLSNFTEKKLHYRAIVFYALGIDVPAQSATRTSFSAAMTLILTMRKQGDQNDDRNRYANDPEKY
jgi:hypothetical protein